MKNYTIYLILFLSVILTGCSDSDNDDDDIIISFEPVEVKFTLDFITGCNQIATINGVKLSFIAYTENENNVTSIVGTCDWDSEQIDIEDQEDNIYFGFADLALLGGVFEIDFSDLNGASKISIAIEDACGVGCTKANLYGGNTIVATTANTKVNDTEDLVFDNLTSNASKVRVWSLEGSVYKITIE